MSLHLPPKAFRDSYEWRGFSLDGAACRATIKVRHSVNQGENEPGQG